MHAPELRRHARVYMAGLRLIINSMNDDEKLETALRGIAQAHVKWHIHKYHLIVSSFLDCMWGKCFLSQAFSYLEQAF
jgi:hypothetical protein